MGLLMTFLWWTPTLTQDYFGMQAIPVPGQPVAYGPLTWPAPADVVAPAYGWTPEPMTIRSPQASAWHQPAIADWLNEMCPSVPSYDTPGVPTSNFPATVSPQSIGPRPPFANVLAYGNSFTTQGLENEGLDLSLRL
ncbi:hypothetical protein ACJRO7_007403 [Eucalyptus globulus]|uniref:Uncharacterized protein n=1 Tax=Eucalyptus globulus TaxID=34317 RepID=A0ABD3INQ2_EUCGL